MDLILYLNQTDVKLTLKLVNIVYYIISGFIIFNHIRLTAKYYELKNKK